MCVLVIDCAFIIQDGFFVLKHKILGNVCVSVIMFFVTRDIYFTEGDAHGKISSVPRKTEYTEVPKYLLLFILPQRGIKITY